MPVSLSTAKDNPARLRLCGDVHTRRRPRRLTRPSPTPSHARSMTGCWSRTMRTISDRFTMRGVSGRIDGNSPITMCEALLPHKRGAIRHRSLPGTSTRSHSRKIHSRIPSMIYSRDSVGYAIRASESGCLIRSSRCCTHKGRDGILRHRRASGAPNMRRWRQLWGRSGARATVRRKSRCIRGGGNGRRVSRRWAAHRPDTGR